MRSIFFPATLLALLSLFGCNSSKPDYGIERPLSLPGHVRQTWAVAPVINLSGQKQVDPILQGDLLCEKLGEVAGITPLPVNRIVEVFAALRLEQVQSEEQAALVCDLLGCDALLVAAVKTYDPFDPPKMGAALTLFRKGEYRRPADVDPYVLARRATPLPGQPSTTRAGFVQVDGMFDASNGSIQADVMRYAQGRTDPDWPYKERTYLIEMDRYSGFVYHSLIAQLLAKPALVHGDRSNLP